MHRGPMPVDDHLHLDYVASDTDKPGSSNKLEQFYNCFLFFLLFCHCCGFYVNEKFLIKVILSSYVKFNCVPALEDNWFVILSLIRGSFFNVVRLRTNIVQ